LADNVEVTAGTGTTIAADDVGGVLYQRVKLAQGADGSATDVSTAAPLQVTLANTGANATPVVVDLGANNDVTVTSGSITATQATGSNLHTVVDSGTITTVSTVTSVTAIGTSVTPGTSAAHLGKAVDAVAGASDTGVAALAVRLDTLSTITPAEGDYSRLLVDSTGALHTTSEVLAQESGGNLASAASSLSTIAASNIDAGTAGTASADVVSVQGIASMTPVRVDNGGTFLTQENGGVLTALQLIDDAIVADDAAFTAAATKVMMAGFVADEGSTDSVTEDDAGAARMTLDRKQIVTPQPHTAGGLSAPVYSLDLDETHESIKGSAGCLYKIRLTNFATSVRWVHLYDHASPTVGTTVPVDTIPVPAGSSTAPTVITENFGGMGLTFGTAITWAATTASNATGAPSALDVVASAYFK
jgi:hypothetical protein